MKYVYHWCARNPHNGQMRDGLLTMDALIVTDEQLVEAKLESLRQMKVPDHTATAPFRSLTLLSAIQELPA